MKTAILILQLVTGVVLIQWHAIPFWSNEVDPHAGWALAIMIEAVALSFWWSRSLGLRALALTATVMLLAGPMYHLGKPIYQDIRAAQGSGQTAGSEIALLTAELEQEQKALNTFLGNSKERTGWLPAIEDSRENILALNREIANHEQDAAVEHRIRWEEIAPVAMYIWVLLLVQINNVRMIRLLSAAWATRPAPAEQPAKAPRPQAIRMVRKKRKDGRRLGAYLQGQVPQEALA